MTPTELATLTPEKAIAAYGIADAWITEKQTEYMPLAILNVADKTQFKAVDEARKEIKSKRCAVERTRKALVADALDWQRVANGEAKRLTGLLKPIEDHLDAEVQKVKDAEVEAARIAAAEAERQRLAAIEAEKSRVKAEQDAERARLKAIADEQAAKQKELDRQAAELAAEKARFLEATKATPKASLPLFPDDSPKPANATQAAIFAGAKPQLPRHDFFNTPPTVATVNVAANDSVALNIVEIPPTELDKLVTATPAPNDLTQPPWESEKPVLPETSDLVKLSAIADALDAIPVPEVSPAGEAASTEIVLVLEEAALKVRAILERM